MLTSRRKFIASTAVSIPALVLCTSTRANAATTTPGKLVTSTTYTGALNNQVTKKSHPLRYRLSQPVGTRELTHVYQEIAITHYCYSLEGQIKSGSNLKKPQTDPQGFLQRNTHLHA